MIALSVGLLVGAVLGLTGAGGSVIALPLLYHLLGLSAHDATGISLGAVAASAWIGVITRARRSEIVWLPGLIFAASGALFAPVGQVFAKYFSEVIIIAGFSTLMLYIGVRMWRQAISAPEDTRSIRAVRDNNELPSLIMFEQTADGYRINLRKLGLVLIGGLGTGILSGFFGVGGGFIIIPMLVTVTGILMKQAVGTSLFIVAMISSSGFLSFFTLNDDVPVDLLGQVAAGGVVGMLLGTFVGSRLAGPTLQKVFAGFVVCLAIVNIFDIAMLFSET
jgi:uncharacterized membrane protein YfcA